MAESKLFKENSSYNMSSISIDVFSMLSLCRILISHLVTNLFMHSLPDTYDSTLLGHAFFNRTYFCLDIITFVRLTITATGKSQGKYPTHCSLIVYIH